MSERGGSQATRWEGEAVYARVEGVILRAIAEQSLLVPVQGGLVDLQQIYALHGVGDHVWQHLDGKKTLDEILTTVLERYEVSADEARADIGAFVAALEGSKLIERRP
jgi:hypothetical protein